MSGLPVALQHEIPKDVVTPTIGATSVGRLTVAASKSGTSAVGTMDSTPTEAEVTALMQVFAFASADDVRQVHLQYVAGKPASGAAAAVLAVYGGDELDDATAAQALAAGYPGVIECAPNTIVRLFSLSAITKVVVCALPSSITSANHEGQWLFIRGYSENA